MHPLVAFARWGWDAPYVADGHPFSIRAAVVPVRSKTGLVAARQGGLAHLDDGVAAIFGNGRARFGARYLCGHGSTNVIVLATAAAYGGVCAACVDAAKGPCVYRCFGRHGELLYIGSTLTRLRRLKQHAAKAPWWPDVAGTQAEHFPTIFEARAAERLAILAENPLHNKQPINRHEAA